MCSQGLRAFGQHGGGSGSSHTHALWSAFPSGLQGGVFIPGAAAFGPEADTTPGGILEHPFINRPFVLIPV